MVSLSSLLPDDLTDDPFAPDPSIRDAYGEAISELQYRRLDYSAVFFRVVLGLAFNERVRSYGATP